MKKIAYNILLAGLASVLIAHAQPNPATPAQPADTTNVTSLTTASGTTNIAVTTPAPAVVDTNTPTAVTTTVTTTVTSNSVLAGASATNAPAPANAGIPLIQFSDVPITTAIENLARQAGINYMLDPKIGYGQPDASGQVRPEPTLSIRWENITAESALRALLDNYGLQLVEDKKTGIDRIALKDPLAPPPLITRVIQLQYASVSNMVEAVQSVFGDKRSRVIPDSRTSQLLVVATDPEQQAVDTLVAQLDKRTKQVLIETKYIDIASTPSAKRGVDWSQTLNAQNVTFGNGILSGTRTITGSTIPAAQSISGTAVNTAGLPIPSGGVNPNGTVTTSTTTDTTGKSSSSVASVLSMLVGGGGISGSTASGLIPTTGFLNADGVSAVISFINASYESQTIATPRIVTLDNEKATISVTRNIPVISITPGTQQAQGAASITYSNVGTILEVTPRVSANDNIWLKVVPEISSHFADVQVTVSGGSGNASTTIPVPEFDCRKMETQVLIPNGDTLVMGGLVSDQPTESSTKVPFLGDIPGLGWAFHSESKTMNKDSLIIFICPTIVKDNDFQNTPTTYLQSKPKTMRSPMNPHQPWDGADPERGWSNPAPIEGEFDKVKNVK